MSVVLKAEYKGRSSGYKDPVDFLVHLFVKEGYTLQQISSYVIDPNSTGAERVLMSMKFAELGLNNGLGADPDLIYRLTPDLKYWKYLTASSEGSVEASRSYWKSAEIDSLLSDVVKNRKNIYDLAETLGVTPEMISCNIVKSQCRDNSSVKTSDKDIYIPIKEYPTFKKYDLRDFWTESLVQVILEEVRSGKVSISEGSKILGVSLKKLKTRVGMKDSTESLTKPKRDLTVSTRASPYEKLRDKNVAERQALFRDVFYENLGDSCAKRKYTKREIPSEMIRPPSDRIQRKKSYRKCSVLESLFISREGRRLVELPPVLKMDADEFFTSGLDYQWGKRVLNDVTNSLNSSSRESDLSSTFPSELFSNPLRVVQVCENFVNACDVLETPFLCVAGDNRGELGISRKTGSNLSFRVHSNSISSLNFNWCLEGGKGQIISSGMDGYLRGLDLEHQKLETLYQWSYHSSEKEILWHRQICTKSIALGFHKYTYVFDVRSGKREIKFPPGNGYPISLNSAYRHFISIPTQMGFKIVDMRRPMKDFFSISDLSFALNTADRPTISKKIKPVSVFFNPSKGTDLLINYSNGKICVLQSWLSSKVLKELVDRRERVSSEAKWLGDSTILYAAPKTKSKKLRTLEESSNYVKKYLGFPDACAIYAYDMRSGSIIGTITEGIFESDVGVCTNDSSSNQIAITNCAGKGTLGILN